MPDRANTPTPSKEQFSAIRSGYHPDPARSLSLRAEAYTSPAWFNVDPQEILAKSWQWVCHAEKVRAPGTFTTTLVSGHPIAVIRDEQGVLRAFYNVCKHRAHPVLVGEGMIRRIVCPYHAGRYRLGGSFQARWSPRFVTGRPTSPDAGKPENSAYDTSGAKVRTHAVWWLWPNTCLMRYPGRSSVIVLHIIPVAADRTLETYDFFLETPEPDELEKKAIHYLDAVLQAEDIISRKCSAGNEYAGLHSGPDRLQPTGIGTL